MATSEGIPSSIDIEFLELNDNPYIYSKPKNQRERDYNDNMTEKAEAVRCRRFESIVNERYDFFDKEKQKGDFLAYFKKKAEEKNTKWENVYKYFERFCEGKCTFGEITVDFCVKFMEYLQTTPQIHRVDKKLHINTAAGYWSTDAKPSAIKLV